MSRQGMALLLSMFLLIFIGIVMIYSASAIYADQNFQDSFLFLRKQILYFMIGFVCFMGAFSLKPEFLEKYSHLIVLIGIILLALVYLPSISRVSSGARRWLRLFNFNFQPAEFSKLALIIYFADYLKRKIKLIRRGDFQVLLPPLFILGVYSSLIIMQPDLGSVILLFFATAVLFFIAGIRQRYIFSFLAICSVFFYFAVIKVPYRLSRITAYLNPWEDPKGSGFQIIQSFVSFGLGGLKGVGLGASTQKLFYLPQSYTDFIYSIIAEEGGFIASVVVICIYFFMFWQGVLISLRQIDLFRRMVSFTLCALITFQALLNIFVCTGLIPTKGLPLPFISYGGSSLIINMIAIGIILSIDRDKGYWV